MDNLENKPPSPSEPSQLQAELDSLRNLVVSILVLLVVVSGTLTVYLARLAKTAGQELDSVRPQVNTMVAQYQQYLKNAGPVQDKFIRDLTEYGSRNPDFVPILNKHGLKPAAGNAPSAPVPSVPVPGKK